MKPIAVFAPFKTGIIIVGKGVLSKVRDRYGRLTVFVLIAYDHVDVAAYQIEEEAAGLVILIIPVDHAPKGLVTRFEAFVYGALLPVGGIGGIGRGIEMRHHSLDIFGVDVSAIYVSGELVLVGAQIDKEICGYSNSLYCVSEIIASNLRRELFRAVARR